MTEQTLTAMTNQVRRPGRVNLELDGQFWRGASLESVAELGLRVGLRISAEELPRLEGALETRRAFESALRILAARGRTRREIRDRLARKGFSDAQVEGALLRCSGLGLLDDEAVLRGRAESLRARGAGDRRARVELERLGAGRELLDEVIEEIWPAERRGVMAVQALERHARPERLASAAERRRALAWLIRQGHSTQDARAALEGLGPVADAQPETGGARASVDEGALSVQLARRFPGAAHDARERRRAYGWAARRGADYDTFRRALAAAEQTN